MGLFARTGGIDAGSAAERLAGGSVVVVDVREPAEWRTGHICGAVNVPLTQLASRLHRLPSSKTIVTVCRSGHRSAVAARLLRRAGYEVENLKGGMGSWARAGLPLSGPRRRA